MANTTRWSKTRCHGLCATWRFLGFSLVVLLVTVSVVFHTLFDAWEQRVGRLEESREALLALVSTFEQRIIVLEAEKSRAKSKLDGGKNGKDEQEETETQCSSGFGEFSSRENMQKQGWYADVDEAEYDPGFLGWKNGMESGTLYAFFHVAGKLTLKVSNKHEARESMNYVRVWLNEERVAHLGPSEHAKLCLFVKPGDVLAVREKYGKLWVRNVALSCSTTGTNLGTTSSQTCAKGQKVKWRSRICSNERWSEGVIDRVLNSSRATVAHAPNDVVHMQGNLYFANDLYPVLQKAQTQPNGEAPSQELSCNSFAAVAQESVGIVVVANKQFLDSYSLHVKSQRCYASWRGYDFWILKPGYFDACDEFSDNIFFEKHCIIAEFLKQHPPRYVAVVIDADMMAVVLERGVEQWLSNKADLMFYERDFQHEIAAGNYIARNTDAARGFLMDWARFKYQQPPGFSSADNGAIHLHLIESLRIKGAERCRWLYTNLTATVENLRPYFAYVACTLRLLGPARTWKLGDGGGLIALWPRLSFFAIDGFSLNRKYNDLEGPIFHHGIKQKEEAKKQYLSFDHCVLNSAGFAAKPGELGKIAMGFAKSRGDLFKPHNTSCKRCFPYCLNSMNCQPLETQERR